MGRIGATVSIINKIQFKKMRNEYIMSGDDKCYEAKEGKRRESDGDEGALFQLGVQKSPL